MKEGRTLSELAKEIERQKTLKRDFIAPNTLYKLETSLVEATEKSSKIEPVMVLKNGKTQEFRINNFAHGQIATKFDIPKKYYEKMLVDDPRLLVTNVNHWISKDQGNKLIRTLDGRVRALLSERFRPLDNYDLMTAVLPIIEKNKATYLSGEVTDTHLYIKALQPKIQAEIKVGDVVQAGVIIQNSEVGASSIRIEPMIYRLACQNGMITSIALRKYHVGKGDHSGEFGDNVYEILSNKSKELTDAAFWNTVKDITKAAFSEKYFLQSVDQMKAAVDRRIKISPEVLIETIVKKYGHSDQVGEEIMRQLITEGDMTQYGLANAVTATSQAKNLVEYDEATELERTGGKIIELERTDWEKIAC